MKKFTVLYHVKISHLQLDPVTYGGKSSFLIYCVFLSYKPTCKKWRVKRDEVGIYGQKTHLADTLLELELCESILLKQGEVGIHDDKDNLSYRSIVQKKKMFLSQKRICLSVWCKGDPPGLLFFPSRNILRASWNPSSEPFSIGLFL